MFPSERAMQIANQMYREAKDAAKRGQIVIVEFADGSREVVNGFRNRKEDSPQFETLRGWTHEFAGFASFEKVTDAQNSLYPDPQKKAA